MVVNMGLVGWIHTFHEIISKVKRVKILIKEHKEIIIQTIDEVKDVVSIDKASKIFNISRGTFENTDPFLSTNGGVILQHTCTGSYLDA